MKHLAFILWMILYPVACAAVRAIYHRWVYGDYAIQHSANALSVAMALELATWIFIGVKLWEAA